MKNFDDASIASLYLRETEFASLMQKRIHNVLLIATPYDAFMMEEDGRVEEQVYFEYHSLNLSSPPRFTKAANYEEAARLLNENPFDLIIAMPGVDVTETFTRAREIDLLYPDIPFVVLTPFSKEVRRRIADEDLSGVDYVFSWLGDVDLILAIIKLIEDNMNADHDILGVGIQAVLLIEDSIRFYSAILPHLFKFMLRQSTTFATEALNEHERMLRMRGRPKVLLARDYEEAQAIYEKYGKQMLGIVSDVRFPIEGEKYPLAGLKFAAAVHEKDPYLPFIFESAEAENRERVNKLDAIFLDKNSKTLPQDLRRAVRDNFGFGPFIVRNPADGGEIMRIESLKDLQHKIFDIPDEPLFAHCSKNDFSRWLYSRALFPIAESIRAYRFTEMSQAPQVRRLIFDTIVKYRRMKNRGVVALFKRDRFDRYSNFARIGSGSMGGKGRGLAFIDSILKRHPEAEDFQGAQITIPRTIVICTDIFDKFMELNNLYPLALSSAPDSEILAAFIAAKLPVALIRDFDALLKVVDKPLAVRSSSLLEDSHYQPFAGVYSTYMVPYTEDTESMKEMLANAVKGVYASVFFAESKAYMNATQNVIDQEKMAVILQEVAGEQSGELYFPSLSGVGRSINYYPIGDEVPDDGVAEIAAGLGKYIVDGDRALRFSPAHPKKVLQTSTLKLALRDTQTFIYALPGTHAAASDFSTNDSFNIVKVPLPDVVNCPALRFDLSTYDMENGVIRDYIAPKGRKLLTFNNILKNGVFPLAPAVEFMLRTGQYEMGRPVEIEFAANVAPDANTATKNKGSIYWLQIRPIVDRKEMLDDSLLDIPDADLILRSDTALGHGLMDGVKTVVYLRPDTFDSSRNQQVARKIEEINARLVEEARPYVLIGPGRWGSSDSALGVPVKWAQIAGAKVIAETTLPGYSIEPSQGTHFFQNLTSFGVAYFTIDPVNGKGLANFEYLDSLPAEYEDEALRVVSFELPMEIAVNGRKSKGIVTKPGIIPSLPDSPVEE